MENILTTSLILGVIVVVLTALKLAGFITITWLWVLSPFWIPIGLFAVAFTIEILIRAALSLTGG